MFGSTEARRQAALVLIALAGALLGHVVGYQLAGVGLPELHHHLGPVATLLIPLGALALGSVGWKLARGADLDFELAQGRLTLFMLAAYSSMEFLERAAASHDPTMVELAPVLAGLVAQPLMAWLLVRVAALVGTALASLIGAASSLPPTGRVQLRPAVVVVRDGRRVHRGRTTRGPPRS
jgi:hypothetical protein